MSPVGTKSNSRIATSFTLPTEKDCPINGGTEFAIESKSGSPETWQAPVKKTPEFGSTIEATGSVERAIPPSMVNPIEFPPVMYPICSGQPV